MLTKTLVATVAFVMLAGNSIAQGPWVPFVDPNEHAYSIEIPNGWQVSGGLQRRSAMQAHSIVFLRSPKGATQMVLGNVDNFSYSIPTPLSNQLGFHEGSITSPGADHLKMLNYRTGKQFAIMTGKNLFNECQNLKLVGSRDLPGRQPQPQANGLAQGATIGDAFFTCERDGHKLDGYVYSETEYTRQPNVPGGVWDADNTYAFLTPDGNGAAAGIVLAHIVKSAQINQQWLAQQSRLSAELANHAIAQADARLSTNANNIDGTFANPSSQDIDQNQAEMERLISGFDEYETASGEHKTVPYAAATNWWSNGQGQIVGTQGPLSPGMTWQPMKRVPPGQQ